MFERHLVPGTTFKRKISKTKVVPGTKYGVFRYILDTLFVKNYKYFSNSVSPFLQSIFCSLLFTSICCILSGKIKKFTILSRYAAITIARCYFGRTINVITIAKYTFFFRKQTSRKVTLPHLITPLSIHCLTVSGNGKYLFVFFLNQKIFIFDWKITSFCHHHRNTL